jgi:hypothetical protein
MSKFRKITEVEAAAIASDSEAGRMLVMECGLLRELVKAKDEYIACHKTSKRLSEEFFTRLERVLKEVGE